MNFEDFKASLKQDTPPANLSLALQALWYAGKGDWHAAHNITQDDNSKNGAWVHAYLHREEGDMPNARYWYARADQPPSEASLGDEWAAIAETLL